MTFEAYGNTMNGQAEQLSDLLPNFLRRDEGGVVCIAELQSMDCMYVCP